MNKPFIAGRSNKLVFNKIVQSRWIARLQENAKRTLPSNRENGTTQESGTSFVSIALRSVILLSFLSIVGGQHLGMAEPADSVNPFVGTGRGPNIENLFPGVTLPFGMVQISPDTESHGYGYHYYQDTIQGFSMTHMSGVGCANEGDVLFTPTSGPVHTQIKDFQSQYSHSEEAAQPGYYKVQLLRWAIKVELTATDRTGIVKLSFPAGRPANILVPISHTLNHTVAAYVRVVGNNRIDGYVVDRIFCGSSETYKVYFVMVFSHPFSTFGTWSDTRLGGFSRTMDGNRTATQISDSQKIGAYATWPPTAHPQIIIAKIGISYVDLLGAENNLKTEAAGVGFSEIRQHAATAWSKALRVIDVSGGTPRDRNVFYTALYHCLMMPNVLSDADGRYAGFDNRIHHISSGHLVYSNYSGWDIYRSEMPLLALIEPKRVQDMAQSIVLMYRQGGWIGSWPQANRDTNVTPGSPLTTILCTIWLDGLHGFDVKTAWEGMLLDATHVPPSGRAYPSEVGIQWINRIHYVPNDRVSDDSVSDILEDSIAYASLYRLAVGLGKADDAKILYQRALYYRNVFDWQDRFFRPRNADGQWVKGFNPMQGGHGFLEGSGWHYQWLVPCDMSWLIHAVGLELFNHRLNEFFDYKQPGWHWQYYNPYNETDLEAPFEFNFSGMPWESQRAVRRVLAENYTDTPDGIPGNEDCGEMSSWAVLSMMGIYTVDPASLAYELVSPVFSKIVIHLQSPYQGKTFTIGTSANPESTPYIQSVHLNGKIYAHNWVSFRNIHNGGTLRFSLGSEPNRSWGTAANNAPPSLSDVQP